MMQRIDLAPLLRETVATPYSDMVTRSTGAALRDRILAEPERILEDRDVMAALIGANERALGSNIVDLRGIAMERLGNRLDRLEDTHREARANKRPAPEFELIAGERRWRASQLAGLAEIPAMVRPMTDTEALEAQVIENLQREDVTELEEAEGYRVLMDSQNISMEQVAQKIGKRVLTGFIEV